MFIVIMPGIDRICLSRHKNQLRAGALFGVTGWNMDNKEERAEEFYSSFLTYTESLFYGLAAGNELDFQSIQKMVKMICEFIQTDRNSIVCVMKKAGQHENPHVSHSARSSIIAIIIGTYMKLPAQQLIELGVAGLLCNIGVLNLSGQIYTSGPDFLKTGTDMEKKLLYLHPIYAYSILRSSKFPLSICEAVLQHHELEDGSGYPKQLKGKKIGLYGKILVVAGFYEAFLMERTKRGYGEIIQILKNGGSFDVSVIRALVNSICIYPAGIYILLSNGEYGQAADMVC